MLQFCGELLAQRRPHCTSAYIFETTTKANSVEIGVSGGSVVRWVGAPYRRVRIPGSSDLRVCVLSANKDIAPRTRCFIL